MRFAYISEPPFNFVDETGRITGCDVELARHVFMQLGLQNAEFIETDFADLLPGLERGDWHMTTGLFASPARDRQALFTRPIWALPDGLLVRSEDVDRINGYKACAANPDRILAVIKQQVQHQTARDLGVATDQILVFDTYTDAANAVLQGRADAYASVMRAHEGYLSQVNPPDLAAIEVPASEKPPSMGCFAVARLNQDLKTRLDQILTPHLGSDAHRHMMRRFGFRDADVDRLLQAGLG